MSTYAEYWKDWVTVTPPRDVLAPHHEHLERWPAFERLCDEADNRGLDVEMTVSSALLGEPERTQHRDLTAVLVVGDDITPLGRAIGDDLDQAAVQLTDRLVDASPWVAGDPYGDEEPDRPIFGD